MSWIDSGKSVMSFVRRQAITWATADFRQHFTILFEIPTTIKVKIAI